MAKVTMDLKGFDALQRAIKEAPDLVRRHAEDTISKTTFSAAQRMRGTVRVNTGQLKRSITTSVRGLSGRVLIAPEAFHWKFLEYGTVKMPASPFIRPAAEAEAPVYLQRMHDFVPKLERLWTGGGRFL